jgi:hypothetical protein
LVHVDWNPLLTVVGVWYVGAGITRKVNIVVAKRMLAWRKEVRHIRSTNESMNWKKTNKQNKTKQKKIELAFRARMENQRTQKMKKVAEL